MKAKVIYKCQNCGEIFDGERINITVCEGESITTQLQKHTLATIIHPCSYQVWGTAIPLRFEGPIVSGEV
nr:MAG TPA: DNA-directed RNA polymerase II subunit [Caudoviricetes sp.]